jgi:glycerol-3-phosphate dehydrogenase (NAD(P)+)
MSKISIIGAGAFGTALATVAARAGHAVTLWGRDGTVVDAINRTGTNTKYLPDYALPASVTATTDAAAIVGADAVLLAVPAQSTRSVLAYFAPHIAPNIPLVICSKGLEQATGQRLDQVVQSWRSTQAFALLSGPGFDTEIAAAQPTAVTIAAPALHDAEALCALLATDAFRPYAHDDVIGVALAGALKNPLAIGAGIIGGAGPAYGLGENARAAFITRGMAEIMRLGIACGANSSTFMGLAGVGDVFLTCSSTHSRNYRYGYALACGEPLPATTVEGLPTIAAALMLGAKHNVDLPLMNALHALTYQGAALTDVLAALLARPLRSEGR